MTEFVVGAFGKGKEIKRMPEKNKGEKVYFQMYTYTSYMGVCTYVQF